MFITTRKVLALLVLTFAFSAFASAQAPVTTGPVPSKIGVIDIQRAIVATNEGRRDFEALTKKFEPKQTELKTLNDEVENLKKQLTAQGDKLNEDERGNRARTIQQKEKNLQRLLEDAQQEFQTAQNELAQRIGQKMMAIVEKYARANGIALVVDGSNPQSGLIWAAEQTNISQAIVDAYNTQSGIAAPAAPAAPRPAASTPAPAKKPATTTKQ
ncbi:MAG TPA: OmpH family outer membrane protein [Terriglobales bacterium]|nr:OmpH family outer membrane protein [Terriglobales bacterium]